MCLTAFTPLLSAVMSTASMPFLLKVFEWRGGQREQSQDSFWKMRSDLGGVLARTELSYSETFGAATRNLRVHIAVFCKFTFGKDRLDCRSITAYLFTTSPSPRRKDYARQTQRAPSTSHVATRHFAPFDIMVTDPKLLSQRNMCKGSLQYNIHFSKNM